MPQVMRNCCVCKKPIYVGSQYYHCSVSTCNKKSNPQSFCSLSCWDVHVPVMNHKNAWACEETATASSPSAETPGTRRVIVTPEKSSGAQEKEILVVASKVKQYIRDQSEFNTSAGVLEVLSDILRNLCDEAMEKARQEGRKTVMDRDFL